MAEREVKARLVAETSEYVAAVKRAAKHSRKLTKALKDLDEIVIRIRVERS